MRGEISDSEFDLAFERASPEITIFISNVNEGDVLVNSLINLKLPPADARQIKREIIYVALGLARLDEFSDNVLANTEGDEELVSFAIDFIIKEILPEIETIAKTYQINIQKPGNNQTQPKTSADILLKEIGANDTDDNQHGHISTFTPTKRDLLAEIESPTESTIKPNIILPKSKPATSDVLKGLVNAPYNMSDTVKITDGDQVITIIDPFKKKLADERSQNQVQNPINPSTTPKVDNMAKNIGESRIISSNLDPVTPNSDQKFGFVVKNNPNETYKVINSVGHDPYREAPTA